MVLNAAPLGLAPALPDPLFSKRRPRPAFCASIELHPAETA
jgi:hypothetical protein